MLTPDTARGLTLWQPWAELIARGAKRWETRSWQASWRGWILVHAGAIPTGAKRRAISTAPAWSVLRELGDPRVLEELPRKAIVAVARLVEVGQVAPSGAVLWPGRAEFALAGGGGGSGLEEIRDLERRCGDYAVERKVWRLADVERLRHSVRASGTRRLWIPSRELCAAVERELPGSATLCDELHLRVAP